jgi:hypothetical protein
MNALYRRLSISFFFLLQFSPSMIAQNATDYLHYDCATSSYFYSRQYERHFKANQLDSVAYVLELWEARCGQREVVTRAKTIFDLYQSEFDESQYDEYWIDQLIAFHKRMINIKMGYFVKYEYDRPYYGYVPFGENFDLFTKELALRMQSNYPEGSLENELCYFYAIGSDSLFHSLAKAPLANTSIGMQFNKSRAAPLVSTENNYAIFSGIWVPTKDLSTLGVHPEIGFLLGFKKKKFNLDLLVAFRFLKAKNEYLVRREQNNSLVSTDRYFGGILGVDFGYDLFSINNHELQINAGAGIEGFDALKQSDNLDAVSIVSYNFNLGISYRKYFKDRKYVGLRFRYHFVDYTLGNKLAITGFPYTISVVYGSLSKPRIHRLYRSLY